MTSWKRGALVSLRAVLLVSIIFGAYAYREAENLVPGSELPAATTEVETVNGWICSLPLGVDDRAEGY
ncbi:hypothetical protein [Palaeococcus ferrophilus]|uniref:hypothetical protein n=1 Tax=Palaeococcus ferrophilus TaxID=83868 RepID=UPI00064F8C37|nr:hypothetical protein [Palaeococcus ferrophilus]